MLALRDVPPRRPRRDGPPRRPDSQVDFDRGWRRGSWLALIALCLALYLPGFATLPPTDRDESRFAQATKQMLETGDFVRIQFQETARNKKPVGIYWMQAVTAELFGGEHAPIWAFRLPSLLAAILAVLGTHWIGLQLFDRRTAFLAGSLMAASLLVVVEAHLAKTDAALLASTVGAQAALAVLYMRSRTDVWSGGWQIPALFWGATGVAIMLKGPVVPMVSILTIAALSIVDRNIRWLKGLKPFPWLLLTVVIVAPWTVAMLTTPDNSFLAEAVGHDLLPKLLGAQESHGAPPGFYLALLAVCFFPGSIVLIPALARAWRDRLLPAERFCLAWLIPAWIVFEAVPTKLPHYVLPLYPALALLAGRFVTGADDAIEPAMARRWLRLGALPWAIVLVALAFAVPVLPWAVDHMIIAWLALPMALALVGGAMAFMALWRAELTRAVSFAIATGAVIVLTLLGTVLPNIDSIWMSRSAREALERNGLIGRPVTAAGYAEPSLVFLLGTDTKLLDGAGAADALLRDPRAVALVTQDQEKSFQAALTKGDAKAQAVTAINGTNYSKGRKTIMTVYVRAQP